MTEKKQLVPRKHVGKKVSPEQEKEIKQVQDNMTKNRGGKPVAWIEAKHDLGAGVNDAPKKKSVMTIAETKLGVTMVLSKEECKELGIVETKTTKEAIQEIRKRLGLPEKKKRGE